MLISEIFYSIQGEGTLAGVPSVFVRTSGCNLRCVWCDTPYTSWKPEGRDLTLAEIVERVAAESQGYVVVTGGEPMIQPQIGELTRELRARGQHITIETAGTVTADVACDLMSLSPKLKNSIPRGVEEDRWVAMHERARYRPEVIRELMGRCAYQLKFVVQTAGDLDEVDDVVRQVAAARDRVLLMPEGQDVAVLGERSAWLVEECKRRGYRYSPRLHVLLWGARRGV